MDYKDLRKKKFSGFISGSHEIIIFKQLLTKRELVILISHSKSSFPAGVGFAIEIISCFNIQISKNTHISHATDRTQELLKGGI